MAGRAMTMLLPFCGIVLLDQASKLWVQARLAYGEQVQVVAGLFNLHHIRNTGAAWGMLQGWRLPLILFSAAMLVLMVRRRRELFHGQRFGRAAACLLAGGITGNLIDRVRLGYVVDFLDFHHNGWHFPAFNVADSAICIGIGLYLLGQVLASGRGGAPAERGAGEPQP